MPIGTTAAIVGGGLLAAGGGVASGLMQKSAAEQAGEKQLSATRESIAAQERMAEKAAGLLREQTGVARDYLESAREEMAPFRESQLDALKRLSGIASGDHPYWEKERDEAAKAIQMRLNAQGLMRSKKQEDLLGDVETDLFSRRMSLLQGLAGTGAAQSSAGITGQMAGLEGGLGSGLANIYGGLGGAMGSSFQRMGDIQAQTGMNVANAWGNVLSGFNNPLQQAAGSYLKYNQQQQIMNLLQNYGGGGAGNGGSMNAINAFGLLSGS